MAGGNDRGVEKRDCRYISNNDCHTKAVEESFTSRSIGCGRERGW
jgi:hypothetical protein